MKIEARSTKPTSSRFNDLEGKEFERLTVERYLGRTADAAKKSVWSCVCECGKVVPARGSDLVSGNTRSCGCLHHEQLAKRMTKHGKSGTREYRIWQAMLRRCDTSSAVNYGDYGGRGVRVCKRWRRSFKRFLADMGPCPPGGSLDRFPDNNGNYKPTNCRWATKTQQMRNTRTNVVLTYRGQSLPIVAWAELLGVPADRLYKRYQRNWATERILADYNRKGTDKP